MSKEVRHRDKTFKIIPEADRVVGWMQEKNEITYKDYSGLRRDYIDILMEAMYMGRDGNYKFNNEEEKIKALATCDPRDTFDEKTGMDICAAKLEWKNHNKMAKKYDSAHRKLIEAAQIAYGLCMKHYNKMKSIEDDLERTYYNNEK